MEDIKIWSHQKNLRGQQINCKQNWNLANHPLPQCKTYRALRIPNQHLDQLTQEIVKIKTFKLSVRTQKNKERKVHQKVTNNQTNQVARNTQIKIRLKKARMIVLILIKLANHLQFQMWNSQSVNKLIKIILIPNLKCNHHQIKVIKHLGPGAATQVVAHKWKAL